jgi:hypothetical protein
LGILGYREWVESVYFLVCCGFPRNGYLWERPERAERHGVSPPERRVPSLTLLTIGNIVVNVAKSYTYDVQLEIKSGARWIQVARESFFEPAPGRLGERIPRDFLPLFCGFFQLLAVDPTPGIREPKVS